MIRYGLIGCGNIGTKRLLSMFKDKNSKLEFIVGPLKKTKKSDCNGEKMAKKFNCVFTYDRKILLKSNVDAVILSTGPTLFRKIGSEILNSNKHLLIEKPLGVNLSDAKYLTGLAKKKKLVLKTGFNLRFDDAIMEAKKIIEKNMIGKIYFVKSTYVNGSVKTNKNKVGALSDIGSHSLNLLELFIGKKIDKFYCQKISHEHKKDDNGFMILKKNNILCYVHFSFVRWKNRFCFEISGKNGFVKVHSLPKWGRQTLIFGKRVFPSGKPIIKKKYFFNDNSWSNEWKFFKKLIKNNDISSNNEGLQNMIFVNDVNKK